ncbi:hypothetical protein [Verrucomicrobium spinosum]|uniref:hypothetical protein n=1 Tax=Verrucomicrobium spinosum TaxID=2736 RepID=UPI0009461371|nr:hypothetical protein [Verrucomicrobium spinosum]
MTIIERARKLLDTRPGAEEGHNGSAVTFGVACILVWGFGLEPEEAMGLMQEWNQKCVPPWTDRELMYKLNSARNAAHKEPRGYLLDGKQVAKGEAGWMASEQPRKKKVKFDLSALEAVQDPALVMDWARWIKWLRERSPTDPVMMTAETFLDALYEPGEKIMVFENMRSTGGFMRWIGKGTYKLAKTPGTKAEPAAMPLGSPEGMNWLMQPVDGKWRPQRGKLTMSRRTKDSVQRWPYLLLESDKAPFELWLNAWCVRRSGLWPSLRAAADLCTLWCAWIRRRRKSGRRRCTMKTPGWCWRSWVLTARPCTACCTPVCRARGARGRCTRKRGLMGRRYG